MTKVKSPGRFKDAMQFLNSMESVSVADDKNVSTATPVVPSGKDDVAPVCPDDGVDTKVTDTPEKVIPPSRLKGEAVLQDIANVKTHISTDAGNATEVDAVDIKTADAVKAGEKDLTTGVVSKEDNIEGNEAEHIPNIVADSAVMNVEEAIVELDNTEGTPALDRALDKADDVGEELEQFEAAEVAVESYMNILATLRKQGKQPDRATAHAIQIGLRSHSREFFAHTVPSLESFDRPTQLARHNATVSLESGLATKLGELKTAGMAALNKLITLLMDVWDGFTRDIPGMLVKLNDLTKSVADGIPNAGEKIEVSGLNRLTINGEFVGDSVKVVQSLRVTSDSILVKWPNALQDLVGKIGADTESNQIEKAAAEAVTAALSSFELVTSNVPDSLEESEDVFRSPLLPGNRAMFIGLNVGKSLSNAIAEGSSKSGDAVRFVFDTVEGANDPGEITVPTAERSAAAINEVKLIVSNLLDKDEATKALKALRAELGKVDDSESGKVIRGAIQGGLAQHRQFMGYLVGVVKAYIVFYTHVTAKRITAQ